MSEENTKDTIDTVRALADSLQANETEQDYAAFIDRKKAMGIIGTLLKTLSRGGTLKLIGDYDCDGFGSSLMLRNYLLFISQILNIKEADKRISSAFSDRSDGYTLPEEKYRALKEKHDLIVFFDTGSSYEYLDEHESGVIVIDHHPPRRPPESLPEYIFNPGANGKLSTSNGRIVYELIRIADAMIKTKYPEYVNHIKPLLKAMASITLVSDMAALDANNRRFIKEGIAAMNDKSVRWVYFAPKINSYKTSYMDLSFNFINKINSWSRMNRNFSEIEDLMLLRFENGRMYNKLKAKEYDALWEKLEANHEKRKEVFNAESEAVRKFLIETEGNTRHNLVAYIGSSEYDGLNGLIAQNLFGATGINAISLTYHKERGVYVGSGRGNQVKKAMEALYRISPNITFGGHAAACGVQFAPEHKEEIMRAVHALNLERDAELHVSNEPSKPIMLNLNVDEVRRAAWILSSAAEGIPFGTKVYARITDFDVLDLRQNKSGWNFAVIGAPGTKSNPLSIGYKRGVHTLDSGEITIGLFSAASDDTIFLENPPVEFIDAHTFIDETKTNDVRNEEEHYDYDVNNSISVGAFTFG